MRLTRTRSLKLFRTALLVLAAALIAGYAIWRSVPYAEGPRIDVFQPLDGAAISSSTMEVIGKVFRASSLSMNGQMIPVDQQGGFRETVVVFPGMNFVALRAADQFGRDAYQRIEVLGTLPLPSAPAAAR